MSQALTDPGQLHCSPRFSVTLVQRSPHACDTSHGLGINWENFCCGARCCRAMWCPVTVPQQRATAPGLVFLFPHPDAILQLSLCSLKCVQLLNSSFMTPRLWDPQWLLFEGCSGYFSPTIFFFLWDFAVFSAFFNYDFTYLLDLTHC